MVPTFRICESLSVVPEPVSSVAMPRSILRHILACRPTYFDGVDARRFPEDPIRVRFDRDQDRFHFNVWCQCRHHRPSGLRGTITGLAPVNALRPVELRRFYTFEFEGWLALNVWIGQCRKCGRAYWG